MSSADTQTEGVFHEADSETTILAGQADAAVGTGSIDETVDAGGAPVDNADVPDSLELGDDEVAVSDGSLQVGASDGADVSDERNASDNSDGSDLDEGDIAADYIEELLTSSISTATSTSRRVGVGRTSPSTPPARTIFTCCRNLTP